MILMYSAEGFLIIRLPLSLAPTRRIF